MRGLSVVALFAAGAIAWSACSTDTTNSEACAPGDYLRFDLPDGGAEFFQCTPEGGSYVAHVGADPNALPDAASFADAASRCDPAENDGKLGFICAGCSADSDCAAGLVCYPFPNRGGNTCTKTCTVDSDCPPPAAGCGTNNGHCRP